MAPEYWPSEMMVCAAAREIGSGEVVFVGMRLPLLAFQVALGTHAPGAYGLFENGLIRTRASEEPFVTMGDPPNVQGALVAGPLSLTMNQLVAGRVDLGLLGGAAVDPFGNLSTTWLESDKGKIRLPGSGGAADIATLANEIVILMPHESRRFKDKLNYITSPGFGDGPTWRADQGLSGRGPRAIITNLCVFRFDPETARAYVDSLHPGVTFDQVRDNTGFALDQEPPQKITLPPTSEELTLLRRYDPDGFWTR